MSDYLPHELVVKIFTKLPVKSLLRFRSLSKSWCALISSPDFIRKYTLGLVQTSQKVLIMNNVMGGKDIYTLHEEDRLPLSSGEGYQGVTAVEYPRVEVQIAGSCNGILCLVDMALRMCLWNFSVRRQVMIPKHPLRSRSSNMTVGFGFDRIANDYKIMTIHYGDTLRPYIYTRMTATWTPIAPPAGMFYHLRCNSYLIDATLYWVASDSPNIPRCIIMTFDLTSHVFGTIPLPEPSFDLSSHVFSTIPLPEPCWAFEQLGEFNGALAVMCTKGKDPWIWVKKTESNHVSSWSVFLKLESPQFIVGQLLQPTFNGDLLIHTYPDFQSDGDDRVYNTRTGGLSRLLRFIVYCNIRMNTYVESIELLDKGTPCGETIKWSE
uniref:F-box/kelch-repeat protein At3g06240-like n=1 Tax=Erigeron canadensis TaxID=72917 RepID=UPI001CB9B109|nr:F-box/kelch-repeat protein At3g06240-like [Erigeron canadensis]